MDWSKVERVEEIVSAAWHVKTSSVVGEVAVKRFENQVGKGNKNALTISPRDFRGKPCKERRLRLALSAS